MKNLLKILMIAFIIPYYADMKAQTHTDLVRTEWMVNTQTGTDYGYTVDGTNGPFELMFDGNTGTYSALTKPGKSYSPVPTQPAWNVFLPGFTVDMQSEQTVNYLLWGHRASFQLPASVFAINIFGSSDGEEFTQINTDGFIWIPNNLNTYLGTANLNTTLHKVYVPEFTYRYVRIQYAVWSDIYNPTTGFQHPDSPGTGSTAVSNLCVAEFGMGFLTKGEGATVAAPTIAGTASTSITINAVEPPENGQVVEYGINTIDEVPTDWQTDLIFTGLEANTTYYIFARAKESNTYSAGEVSASTEAKTSAAAVPPAIITIELPDGRINEPYNTTLTASGDLPITWEVTDGDLPEGLELSAEGLISGTPSTVGVNAFTVTATNSGGFDEQELSITINKKLGATVPTPTLASKNLTSITINAVTAPATGQDVEYAVSISNAVPEDGWQNDVSFEGLNSNTTYYVFARSKGNDTYEAGVASVSLRVAIDLPGNMVPVDIDRTEWTVSSKNNLTGNDYYPDGSTGLPEHLFTTSTTQYLAFVKPGKTLAPVSCPADFRPYFIVDMKSPQTFVYFRWLHRQNNTYNYLRVFAVKIYESNDGENFVPILPEYPEAPDYPDWFWIPNSLSYISAATASDANYYIINTPETTCQYIKVEIAMWSDAYQSHHPSFSGNGSTSGSSASIGQFGLGTLQNATTPVITTSELAGGTVGVAYNQTLAATALPQPTWSIDEGNLPASLTLSTAGVISGTPSKAGQFTFTVKASNAAGNDSQELSMTIAKGEGATVGAPTLVNKGSSSIVVEVATPPNGQEVEYAINITDEAPDADWLISPTFTDLEEGTEYFIFARAKENDDYLEGAISASLPVTTNTTPVPPTITTTELEDGMVYEEYSVIFTASGDVPITWEIDGDLPEGLTFEDGVISGTPTEVGTFPFTVIATNAEGSDEIELSITIAKAVGKTVSTPTLAEKTTSSVIINAVVAPNNGQEVEYAINTTNQAPAENWQLSCTFEDLNLNVYYYIFARAKENDYYEAGVASASLQVMISDGTQLPGDIDRTGWTVTTQTDTNYGYVPDGTTGLSEHLFDGNATTFLSLVKPGKSYSPVPTQSASFLPSFTVDMKSDYSFNYIVWQHRGGNTYNYLRVYGVNVYGSQNGDDFTPINTEGIVWIPNVGNYVGTVSQNDANSYKIEIPESNYRYVKIELVMWSDIYAGQHPDYPGNGAATGSTMQIGEFGLGLILKEEGTEVATPVVAEVYSTSITINPVELPANGQLVEYGINADNAEPTKWQNGLTFDGLNEGTTYYIFARAKENFDYKAGQASLPLEVATKTAAVPPVIITSELPSGNVDVSYNTTLDATGDNPKTWEITEGDLPDGLELSLEGVISGMPTTVGVSTFTVTVTNTGGSDDQEFSITINKKLGATVSTPMLANKDLTSITIDAVTPPANGQEVEYAVSIVNAVPETGWQDELLFDGLNANTTYYVFARSKGNEDFEQGAPSASLRVAIDLPANLVADDLDRTEWTVSSKNNLTGNDYYPDGSTGLPEHLFTTSTTQYLAFVKPGKTLAPVSCPADFRPYFIVDMKSPQTFVYFRWLHRQNNTYNYLRVFAVKIYESNDGENFTPILPEHPEAPDYPDWFWIPNSLSYISAVSAGDANYYIINTPETTCQYVKVEIAMWSDAYRSDHPSYSGNGSTSGSSVSIGQFGLGNLKTPVVPVITTTTLPEGAVDAAYRQTLEATALPQPTWSIAEGTLLPAGLTMSAAGVISGTPTKAGSVTFTVKASNVAGDDSQELSITIAKGEGAAVDAPTLLGKGATSVTVEMVAAPANGQDIEYCINTSNTPAANQWQTSRTFSGLTANTNYFVFARAKENDDYREGTASASLHVTTNAEVLAPTIITTELMDATVGVAYSDILAATGDAPITWQIIGNLPAGLTLTEDVISGMPTAAGTFTFTVRATNSRGIDNKELFIVIEKGKGATVPVPTLVGKGATNITVTVPAPATGQEVEYIINTENALPIEGYNWQTSYTFTGLSLNTTYYIFARAKEDDNYFEGTVSASLAVTTDATATPPTITTTALPNGSVDAAYNAILAASGDAPITWEIVGNLPAGLTLNGDIITGTPTAVETSFFTVKATNIINSDSKELSITVGKGLGATVAAPTLAGKTRTSITINAVSAITGQEVEYCINTSNAVHGNWQQELVFTDLNPSTVYYIFARAKENDKYLVGAASTSLSVTTDAPAAPPTITTTALSNGKVDVEYSVTLAASGEEPITWNIIGNLPAGLTLSGNVISGTPTVAGQVTFTVKATNDVDTDNKELTITVDKGLGAIVSAPTLNVATSTSITINAVAAPATEQEVEYAINTVNSMPADYPIWQTSLVFTDLSANSGYYIFARAKENDNYVVGEISASLHTTTSNLTSAETQPATPLRARINNGQLYVTGLTEGKTWSIYSMSGMLIYRNIVTSNEVEVALPVSGVYIVQSENKTLKIVIP